PPGRRAPAPARAGRRRASRRSRLRPRPRAGTRPRPAHRRRAASACRGRTAAAVRRRAQGRARTAPRPGAPSAAPARPRACPLPVRRPGAGPPAPPRPAGGPALRRGRCCAGSRLADVADQAATATQLPLGERVALALIGILVLAELDPERRSDQLEALAEEILQVAPVAGRKRGDAG